MQLKGEVLIDMELINARCPICGAAIVIDKNGETLECLYCGKTIQIKQIKEYIDLSNIDKLDAYMLAAQHDIIYAEDFESAKNFYKKALEIKSDYYHAVWGIFVCEVNKIIYSHNKNGYVYVAGDTMKCITDVIEKIGKVAYKCAPKKIQEHYKEVFEYYMQ